MDAQLAYVVDFPAAWPVVLGHKTARMAQRRQFSASGVLLGEYILVAFKGRQISIEIYDVDQQACRTRQSSHCPTSALSPIAGSS
jgi:hypothetical protein